MSTNWNSHRQAIADAARTMADLGLVTGTAGNISARLSDEAGRPLMAVTPASTPYESMTADDIVVTDFDVEPVQGDRAPSSESLLHVGIYRRRPDAGAVVHTHSIYSSVLAVAGIDLPPVIDEVVVYVGGAIRVSRYGFPGTEELADNVCEALGGNKAAFIANHGAVAVGRTLEEALDICLLIERASQIFVMASSLGKVTPIPGEYVEASTAIYRMRNNVTPYSDTGPDIGDNP